MRTPSASCKWISLQRGTESASDLWSAAAKRRCRISAHPNVNFTVVVNPGSGPGPNPLPDGNYTKEIPRLTAHGNVRVLGYVATTYAKRNISSVRNDIETYAAWPTISANPKLTVRGIFFDETPQQYDEETFAYLEELSTIVRNTLGLGPDHFVSLSRRCGCPPREDEPLSGHIHYPTSTILFSFSSVFFCLLGILGGLRMSQTATCSSPGIGAVPSSALRPGSTPRSVPWSFSFIG